MCKNACIQGYRYSYGHIHHHMYGQIMKKCMPLNNGCKQMYASVYPLRMVGLLKSCISDVSLCLYIHMSFVSMSVNPFIYLSICGFYYKF